ncbi:hypothetical protein K503DRAFT_34340 [Rhizopogon vinicolor AM-OR11-026]|uniref:Uncharacterized protein n=1 Tax=Rhizopogon vinicolor AM-OR11-026 TaxID=1314800 RepID=A0A1B7MH30_9AGAM|nr:hypothetical protein K503DRAFT_34340 [Rhizopogon vinicolor AM-OR11-026]
MANAAIVTGPNTPPPAGSSSRFPLGIKSTPNAAGTAAVSEYIGTLGVDVPGLRPFITRDIHDHTKCGPDTMLQELLYRCRDSSRPIPDKSTLLETCLTAVLPICNDTVDIKQHLTAFVNGCTVENESHAHFARAANTALLRMNSLEVSGLPSSRDDNPSDILFHRNDPMPITQYHQGAESNRKPDVVVVSCKSARIAENGGMRSTKDMIYTEKACNAPDANFKWEDVLSTVEFKRRKNHNMKLPPTTDCEVKEFDPPTQPYMDLRKEIKEMNEMQNRSEPPSLTRAPAAASTSKTSNESRRQSERLMEKKRNSEHLTSNEPNSKRSKSNNEKNDAVKEKKEPIKLPAIVQNEMYVAEMFASHVARQHVISHVVNGKSMGYCRHVVEFDRFVQTTSFTYGILIGKAPFNVLASTSFRTFHAFSFCCLSCSECNMCNGA